MRPAYISQYTPGAPKRQFGAGFPAQAPLPIAQAACAKAVSMTSQWIRQTKEDIAFDGSLG
jgi:hypothetical protein